MMGIVLFTVFVALTYLQIPLIHAQGVELGGTGCSTSVTDSCKDVNAECLVSGLGCTCKIGYYDDNGPVFNGTCRKNVELGGTGCLTSEIESCRDVNAECLVNGGSCTCISGYYDDNGSSLGGTCRSKIYLGESCNADTQCSLVANSECRSSRCACKTEYFQVGTGSTASCTKRQLGETCTNTNQCSEANSYCNQVCQCQDDFYDTNGSGAGGSCTRKVSVEENCPAPTLSVPNTATCSDTHATCRGSGNSYRCQCISTHYDNKISTARKCVLRRSLGALCSTTDNNIYQCNDLGASCKLDNSQYICSCNSGYHQESSGCVANKLLGESCDGTSGECSDPGASCIGSKCTCNENRYDSNGLMANGKCLPIAYLKATHIAFTLIQTNQMTVTWSAPENYKQYISGYTVKWKLKYDNSISEESNNLPSTVTTLKLSRGISPGRAYTVTIVSKNDQTQQGSVRLTSVLREQAAKPSITGGIDILQSNLDASDGTIKVRWFAPAGYVSGYYVQLLDGTKKITSSNPTSTFTNFSPSGLKNGYRYKIVIQANSETFDNGKTKAGETYTSEFKTIPKIPNAPTDSTCSSPTDSTISLSWSAPGVTNGDLVKYHIQVYTGGAQLKADYSEGTKTSLLVDGLSPGTHYTFRVFTENEIGVSTLYDSVTTGCETKAKMSEKPRNLEITGITSRGFDISWNEPGNTFSEENYGYILQIKYDQDKCETEVFFNCSDCVGRFQATESDALCKDITRIVIPKTGAELKQKLSYSAALNPDTPYTILVSATNNAGMGYTAELSKSTLEEAPQRPEIVVVDGIKAKSVTVTWTIADPRPGITAYEIILEADEPAEDKVVYVEGFNNRSTVVTGLEEDWNYQIHVKASTSKGSNVSAVRLFRTQPAAPGQVTNLTLTDAPKAVYTWMQIAWRAPSTLERNSILKDYRLDFFSTSNSTKTLTLSHEVDERHVYTLVVDVLPEETYTFTVYATNIQDQKGEITMMVKQAPAGVPINVEDTLQAAVISIKEYKEKEQGHITVNIVRDFFEESTNGKVQATGLMACMKDCDFSEMKTLSDFNSMDSWKKASQNGFTLYRVTDAAWLETLQLKSCSPGRTKRAATNLEFTVGDDECSNVQPDEYCNGPLQPNSNFLFVAVSCTNGGCLLSQEYGPFSTAEASECPVVESNCAMQSLVIGVVLGIIILILAVYASYATLLIRRYRSNKGDSEMRQARKECKERMYANTSFMVGVEKAEERPDNSSNVRDSETEYSSLDDATREDNKSTTYDIMRAI